MQKPTKPKPQKGKTMHRKAILIESSNVSGETDLPGARVDIQNWDSFLRSDLGGVWKSITTLHKPTVKVLQEALAVSPDCYCVVAFSGHGCDGKVALNDAEKNVPTSELMPKGAQGTLVLDSCRGLEEAQLYSFSGTEALRAKAALNESVMVNARRGRTTAFGSVQLEKSGEVSSHKVNWWHALGQSPKGIIKMLSCAKGEGAGEDPKSGGYYTSLLMQSAYLWNKHTSQERVHTTKNAHDYAVAVIPPQQTPEYTPSWIAFPFAVKA